MVRPSVIVVLISTIAIGSGFQRNGYGHNPGSINVRYPPPPPPAPRSIKDRIKVQPPAMPSFNLRAVCIFIIKCYIS